jgi:hypothetical protein
MPFLRGHKSLNFQETTARSRNVEVEKVETVEIVELVGADYERRRPLVYKCCAPPRSYPRRHGAFFNTVRPFVLRRSNDDRSPLNFGSDVSAGTFCWITRAEHTTCRLIVRTLENT